MAVTDNACIALGLLAGGDMDEDDICPICEDDCTCGNSRESASDYTANSGAASMPLFAQIVNQHKPASVIGPRSAGSVSSSASARVPTKKPKKARRQKGAPAGDKSLISRLVSAMGKPQSSLQDNDDGEEEFDNSGISAFGPSSAVLASSDDDADMFVSTASTEQSRMANNIAMLQAARMAKSKNTKRGHAAKGAAVSKTADGWKKKKALEASRVRASNVQPALFEVNAAVIRGREKRVSPARRRMASPKLGAVSMTHDDDEDDEFINITDVTSDGSIGGAISETEFDQARAQGRGDLRGEWSDSRIIDDSGDEDIEQEDAAYLVRMHQSGYSSSSLSDLDEQRMATIRSGTSGSELDSGAESDSEVSDSGYRRRDRMRQKHSPRRRKRRNRNSNHGSSSLLNDSDSELETDQELTFREAQTATEHALVEYGGSGDDREDELLQMHLEQLRAVHNVMQDCSAPLLDYADISDSELSEADGDIVFTYHSHSNGSDDLSDDLMEGWGTDARKRWKDADSCGSDSSVSESKIDKLRLKEEDDEQEKLYSSDSYDEFYTRSAFLDMGSDGIDMVGADDYTHELDLDSASLALGVALSMEQQGYSKEDAAAAAAVAAAAYPNAGSSGGRLAEEADKPAQTTITASMNANGEADPIDGIVSIKSSSGRSGASRMATGTHTPFALNDWRVAAAASAAAAYLDSTKPPAVSYVLPKDLNEARSPRVAMAAAAAAAGSSTDANDTTLNGASEMAQSEFVAANMLSAVSPSDLSSTATASAASNSALAGQRGYNSSLYSAGLPRTTRALSMSSSGAFTSQLPNSSFYKPLSSICTPARDTASGTAGAAQQASIVSAPLTGAPTTGMPLVSLSEVSAALAVLSEPAVTPSTAVTATPLKRKVSMGGSALGADLSIETNSGDKRIRRVSDPELESGSGMTFDSQSLDLSTLFANSGLASASSMYDMDGVQAINPTLSMGAGTPMHGGYGPLRDDPVSDDDWLLTMDQLVDTDALMVQSPPPSPAEGVGNVSGISSHLSLVSGHTSATGASDPFARWDRIPVNIFRRSRALASSSRRHLAAQDSSLGAMSSLAMTAIKSSRQRRALVNSTLLTQHTLSAEAALQQHAMKHALRGDRRGMQRSESAAMMGMRVPPAPPPTPLTSRAMLHHPNAMAATDSPLASISPRRTSRTDGRGVTTSQRQSKALDFSARSAGAADLSGRHRRLVSNGIVTDVGTPCEVMSLASDSSETADRSQHGASVALNDADGNTSDIGYAFGWLEDEEDLSLFAMPNIDEADDLQPSMTMLLASNSPMLMPFRTKSDVGSDRPL
ncbi:hypothetical protein IW148_002168 [Coemansia sp. RSA 1199]|nr:hypothetical protein IW148_002168 [Coemansia sp. RSA 1199]